VTVGGPKPARIFGIAFARDRAVIAEHDPRAASGWPIFVLVCLLLLAGTPARAEPIGWPRSGGPGTPVVLSYSFSNLFDPAFASLPETLLRAAATEAFGLWSRYAPLHFIERVDSGPPPSDDEYVADDHPDIRIGAHGMGPDPMLAHAFFPVSTDVSGLAGDIHFNRDSVLPWGIADGFPVIDFLEVLAHEIGHALGLEHILDADAIMSPHHGFRFSRGASPFLLPADIAAVQARYGAGIGSVQPIPEPSTLILVTGGVLAVVVRRMRGIRAAVS
jgi:hypothetical protein